LLVACAAALVLMPGGDGATSRGALLFDPAASNRPDIVLLSIDTLRADHLPIYGYRHATAPNLKRLASSSVVFTQAFAEHTNTAPCHASMLTGLYPGLHGILRNGMKLAKSAVTLGEMLRPLGYASAAFVSGWTLSKHTGLQRGFDIYEAGFDGSRRSGSETWKLAHAWLGEHGRLAAPLFLFFHLFEPHYPYSPRNDYARRFLPHGEKLIDHSELPHALGLRTALITPQIEANYTARYDGEILSADKLIDKALKRLQQLQRLDNALVIFTSDHGESLFERPWLLDHGTLAYDEQARVPLVVRFPRGQHAGMRVSAQVQHIDFVPTVLDLLKLAQPAELTGRSLRQIVETSKRGQESARPVFTQARPGPERSPDIAAPLIRKGLVASVRLPPYKLIEYPIKDGGNYQQLFDLEADPGETRNLANEHAAKLAELHALLDEFRTRTKTNDRAAAPTFSGKVLEQLRSLGYAQ
jgi:arylsulfatase A-like enzyme